MHVGGGASAVLSSSELLRSGLFCGLVAQGPGSRVEAQRLVVDGATESNVFVEQGAGVLLQDSRCGRVGTRGQAAGRAGAGHGQWHVVHRRGHLLPSKRGNLAPLLPPAHVVPLQADAFSGAAGVAGARARQCSGAAALRAQRQRAERRVRAQRGGGEAAGAA